LPEDWFESFRHAIDNRRLSPGVLYGAPGFAKFWYDLEGDPSYEEQRRSFHNGIPGAVAASLMDLRDSDAVTLVDLGIGTLKSGNEVHRLVRQRGFKSINYVGIDVSYEMLLLGAPGMQNISRYSMGEVYSINCDFHDLDKVGDLIPSGGRRVFLLLGNTLGNEHSPGALLREIGKAMEPEDRLILELQLLNQAPPSTEITERFYKGPFLYNSAGVDEKVISRRVVKPNEINEQLVSFVVNIGERRYFTHPRFSNAIPIVSLSS
jgi:uncharacterized SAM-dependent methyltransferase